jgi:hypothetical protein
MGKDRDGGEVIPAATERQAETLIPRLMMVAVLSMSTNEEAE